MRQYIFLVFAGFIVVLDQLSKWSVTEYLIRPALSGPDSESLGILKWFAESPARWPYAEIEILPIFNIVMVWNKGVSFGLFNQETDYGPLILIILSIIISLWFLIWLFMTQNRLQSFAIAMVIGGAIGNMLDRIRFGAVIDFLDVHAFGYHWPAFNIADSCIVIGVFALIIYSLFFEKNLHQ